MNRLSALAAVLALFTTQAVASPTAYTSRASFEAALAGLGAVEATETFESLPAAYRGTAVPDTDPGPRYGFGVGSLTLSSPAAINDQYVSATGNTQLFTGFANSGTASERYLSFTFAAPSMAFGIDLVAYGSSFTVNALGLTQTVSTTPSFFGVIDPAATASSFTISRPEGRVLGPLTFDNVSTATLPATAVPEPASLALLGAGLLAGGFVRRLRR